MRASSNTKKVKISLMGASGKMGQMLTHLAQEDPEIEIGDEGEVVVDFSTPEGTKKAIAMNKPLVCGTTGLSDVLLQQLEDLSQRVPVLYAPNFSLGVVLCFEMLEGISKKLQAYCSIEIEETHHKHKVDAPSGTAKQLAQLFGTKKIRSNRLDEVIGTHQVRFILEDEIITLKHEALSRKVFARGALSAAKFIFNKPAKLYALKDIFTCDCHPIK